MPLSACADMTIYKYCVAYAHGDRHKAQQWILFKYKWRRRYDRRRRKVKGLYTDMRPANDGRQHIAAEANFTVAKYNEDVSLSTSITLLGNRWWAACIENARDD